LKRGDRERLDDIAEAITTIQAHAADRRSTERIRRDALLYNLLILGGLRDVLAHEYYRIDLTEIERILKRDLPALETAITTLRSSSRA